MIGNKRKILWTGMAALALVITIDVDALANPPAFPSTPNTTTRYSPSTGSFYQSPTIPYIPQPTYSPQQSTVRYSPSTGIFYRTPTAPDYSPGVVARYSQSFYHSPGVSNYGPQPVNVLPYSYSFYQPQVAPLPVSDHTTGYRGVTPNGFNNSSSYRGQSQFYTPSYYTPRLYNPQSYYTPRFFRY